jgi:hypothetical protein
MMTEPLETSKRGKRGDYADQWSHILEKTGYLVRATEHWIVIVDKDGDIDWATSDIYDDTLRANPPPNYKLASQNSILHDVARLEATPCNFSAGVRTQFKRLLGEALGFSLDHDYVGARQMIEAAERYLRTRSEELSRYWYLGASFLATAPFIGLGCILWSWRADFQPLLRPGVFWLLIASTAGATGALLSIITRSGNLRYDCSSGRKLHNLEAASRICAGALSGVLVAAAVQAELILTALAQLDKANTVMALAAFAAGTGERLAPSIIAKFETLNGE